MSLTDEDKDFIQETVTEAISHAKSDFYEMIEPFLKETEANRIEREIVAAKLVNHEDRIENLETKLRD